MAGGISTIIDAVARALWVSHWAGEHERRAEEDEGHELPWEGGDELSEVAPETPWEAYVDAGRVVGVVEERNGLQIDAAWARALRRDGLDWETLDEAQTRRSKEEFGHCLAMESLGSGVSWMDSHEDHGLEVPRVEPGYLPEVFSGVRCDGCGRDLGPAWDNCGDCRRPTCPECLVPPEGEALCRTCWCRREEAG